MPTTTYEHISSWFLGYARQVENESWAGSERPKIAAIITYVVMALDVYFFVYYDTVIDCDIHLDKTIRRSRAEL